MVEKAKQARMVETAKQTRRNKKWAECLEQTE